MATEAALVITSISPPNPVLCACAAGSLDHGIDFIVVGDVSSPSDFSLKGCDFWSIERQRGRGGRFVKLLPERHYARKNLGYLVAIERGVSYIVETDDDNFPRDRFWLPRDETLTVPVVAGSGWVNVYRYFTDAHIWPRGFPLELLQEPVPALKDQVEVRCPIQQGLADENPDVDAVYRLVLPLPQNFAHDVQMALGDRAWTPFNSQNTTWFRDAFPLMYLPSYCSFRMTDIWRSFVAQRICWVNDWHVLFHGPTVWQERNSHDLLRDFTDEVPGYLNNAAICRLLYDLPLSSGREHLGSNLLSCYRALAANGFIPDAEIPLVSAWLEECARLGLV